MGARRRYGPPGRAVSVLAAEHVNAVEVATILHVDGDERAPRRERERLPLAEVQPCTLQLDPALVHRLDGARQCGGGAVRLGHRPVLLWHVSCHKRGRDRGRRFVSAGPGHPPPVVFPYAVANAPAPASVSSPRSPKSSARWRRVRSAGPRRRRPPAGAWLPGAPP